MHLVATHTKIRKKKYGTYFAVCDPNYYAFSSSKCLHIWIKQK